MALPELYKEQDYQRQTFDRDSEFRRLYGVNASRSDARKFNRYWNSDQRAADEKAFNAAQDAAELAHIEAEAKKRAESWDARIAALREQNAARGAETLKSINASLASKPAIPAVPSLVLKDAARWNQVASQYGFNDYNAVAAWQKENGLEADGKFGSASYAKWAELNPDKVGAVPVIRKNNTSTSTPANTSTEGAAVKSAANTNPGYHQVSRQDGSLALEKDATIASTSTPTEAQAFRWNDFTKAFGLDTFEYNGKTYARYDPDGIGDFAIGQDGKIYHYASNNKLGHNQVTKDLITYTMDQPHTGTFKENLQMLNGLMAAYRKQGGTMNRINYFQQGGAAPQQDMQQQVIALVQAAMQGDQKATETVNKIMEAAKAGDKQAMQIAQMIQQVAQKMQGQATAAKWGSKLNYIRSLKFAKGGKTCPACEKGAPIVEKKACGGKKAKKRYFGGLV